MNICNCTNEMVGQAPCGRPPRITLCTVVYPATYGTDAEGDPHAPRPGMHYNTVVLYQSNGAIYIYDSNGIPTNVEPGGYAELVEKVNTLETTVTSLQEGLTALQEKEQSDVDNLQTNINQLENKETEDVADLQTNINTLSNKLDQDVHDLQTNIDAEVADREAADTSIEAKVDAVDVTKLNGLADIKTVGTGLTLADDGTLSVAQGE